METKVSIVVAAYNVEKFIERCLKSLVNQTIDDIEIIVVNDGSSDGTVSIIEEYNSNYTNIKLINQQNQGLSAARNTGIEYANSKYIAFIDGDDYVKETYVESMFKAIEQSNADLVICDFIKVWEDDEFNVIKTKNYNVNGRNLKNNIMKNFLTLHDEPFVVAWNKLYRTSIIKNNKIYFENRAFFEDVGFLPRYLWFSSKIISLNEGLYYYVQRPGSITKTYNPIIEQSSRNTIKIIREFLNGKIEDRYLAAFEVRILLYMINYSLENNKMVEDLYKRIRGSKSSIFYIPLKHKIAVFLISTGQYNKVYNLLRR